MGFPSNENSSLHFMSTYVALFVIYNYGSAILSSIILTYWAEVIDAEFYLENAAEDERFISHIFNKSSF